MFCFSVVDKRFRFSLQSKEKASNTNKRESFPLEMKLWFSNNREDAHKKLLHLVEDETFTYWCGGSVIAVV